MWAGVRILHLPLMDTKRKGDTAELLALYRAVQHGYIPLLPFGDRAPYDFAVDSDGTLIKLQVKSAIKRQDGSIYGRLRQTRPKGNTYECRRIDLTLIDYVVYVDLETDKSWVIPTYALEDYKTEITLNNSNTERWLERWLL